MTPIDRNGQINTTIPEGMPNNRYTLDEMEVVKDRFDLPISDLEQYFKLKDIQNGDFLKYFGAFRDSNINYKEIKFSTLLQYFRDKELLKDNKEFYSEIVTFLDYASEENMLHKNRRQAYERFLKRALFQDNLDASNTLDSLEALDYSEYESNNFRITFKNDAINNIYEKGGSLYLNSDGKICYRLSENSETKAFSQQQAEIILSQSLRFNIKLTKEIPKYTDIRHDGVFISNAEIIDVNNEER